MSLTIFAIVPEGERIADPMWKLVIEDDEGKRTVVPLTRDDYTIGRKEGNTIRLTERNVSREHAKLRRKKAANGAGTGTQYALEDLTSYNGVYVNGLRVASAQDLIHGDLVQIGDYRMVLQDDQVVEAPTAVPSISADSKTTIPASLPNRGVTLMERPNRLVMLAGPTPGAEYTLDRERLTVGRAEDATISVNHNSVSRLHCEIHLLGEARYEIVDKGSSNGVRVNSAELKRGIIEAGDVIELGDVKFKFVGAGQIFLPGVNDSQQLAAIGDRAVPPKSARRMGVLPYVLLGAFVAGALVVAWAYFQHRAQPTSPTPTITSDTPLSKDQNALDAARALMEKGDLEGAHTKLATDIATDTMRQSADFVMIEGRWADDQIARANHETDPSAKKAILTRVSQDPLLKSDHPARARANEMIAAIDGRPATIGTGTASTPIVATPPATTVALRPDTPSPPPPTPAPPPRRTASPPPPPAPAPDPPSPPKPPSRSATELAREASLRGDAAGVKSLLINQVAAGKGSAEDVRMLQAACAALHDQPCLEFVKSRSK